jgi:hypothetical protein
MTKSNIIEYKLQIIDSDFYHDFLDKDLKNKPIKCTIKSELEIKIGSEIIKKEISNTFFINSDEPIYKEILDNSSYHLKL